MRISIENSPSPPPAPRRERSQHQILNSAHGLGRGKQMGQSVGQKIPNAKTVLQQWFTQNHLTCRTILILRELDSKPSKIWNQELYCSPLTLVSSAFPFVLALTLHITLHGIAGQKESKYFQIGYRHYEATASNKEGKLTHPFWWAVAAQEKHDPYAEKLYSLHC